MHQGPWGSEVYLVTFLFFVIKAAVISVKVVQLNQGHLIPDPNQAPAPDAQFVKVRSFCTNKNQSSL